MKIVSNIVNAINTKRAAKQIGLISDYLGTVQPLQFKKAVLDESQVKLAKEFEKLTKKNSPESIEDLLGAKVPQAMSLIKSGAINELVKAEALAKKPLTVSEILGRISTKTK